MPVKWVYASLYYVGIFLLSYGVRQQDMPPMAHMAFGLGIICGVACIQLSEKQ